MYFKRERPQGFTLIELLVVISIISLLSSIVLASLGSARSKARDTKRKSDLKQLQTALEIYHNDYKAYPSTGSVWWGVSVNGGSRGTSGANAYIPGLTPDYIPVLPIDPLGVTTGWTGYLYRSNGSQYKLLSYRTGPESFPAAGQAFYDPVRPNIAWMLCSEEPACTTW